MKCAFLPLNQKSAGEYDGEWGQLHFFGYRANAAGFETLCLDNGGNPGTGYSVFPFDWQLQGPFNTGVCTGLSPFPCSLGQRFNAYSSSSMLFDIVSYFISEAFILVKKSRPGGAYQYFSGQFPPLLSRPQGRVCQFCFLFPFSREGGRGMGFCQ